MEELKIYNVGIDCFFEDGSTKLMFRTVIANGRANAITKAIEKLREEGFTINNGELGKTPVIREGAGNG